MSRTTREINKITTAVICISVKLIVYALIILLLYEAVTRGFAFGHEIFYAEAVDEEPGRDVQVDISPDDSLRDTAALLVEYGLITNEFAFVFQGMFYDYSDIYPGTYTLNTSMTSKEILQILNEAPKEDLVQETQAAPETTAAPASEDALSAETEAALTTDASAAEGLPAEAAGVPAAALYEEQEEGSGDIGGEESAEEEMEEEGGWIADAAGEEAP